MSIRVCVSGAGGLIGYSMIPMIAMGGMFGPKQKVSISLLDINAEKPLQGLNGLAAEMSDCVYPLVERVDTYTDAAKAFEGCDYLVLAGAAPRVAGMERKDLLTKNANIFKGQGEAMKSAGATNAKVLVVGNPANTNALILQHFSGGNPANFTAMTRLDENRAKGIVARETGAAAADVKNVIIWGNHSATQYPDTFHGTVDGGAIRGKMDAGFLEGDFIKKVQQRGAEVIKIRGASSATSAARAAVDHVRDWHLGTPAGEYASMAVWSTGNPYGIHDGLIYSFPCTCENGNWSIVPGLDVNDFSRDLMVKTQQELQEEKEAALSIL
eukprot:NODE_862_length_1148_cov_101.706170_g820_i0.p1 GENE.NODE_862_length_1148_cov_101.706170_g820_i0~~NODE_862_length_1148_cov_101.706170_g820_i0.p1  ORF type:complete len:341 (+),score=120.91 NODE_862_length_1148_cov_101.706170_g820_i0:48-1025(+)